MRGDPRRGWAGGGAQRGAGPRGAVTLFRTYQRAGSLRQPQGSDALTRVLPRTLPEVGATSLRDLGRVMKDVMPQVAGRADGSQVSQLIKEKLA